MKHYYLYVFIVLNTITIKFWAQSETLSSDEAYTQFRIISDSMASAFPEDDMKTYRRASFSETQLQTYLSMHFKRMDLLSKIEGHHSFILNSYLHSGNWFREIGLPKASVKSYKDFFEYYSIHEKDLAPSELEKFIEMQSYAHSILAENYAKLGIMDSAALQHKSNIAFTKHLRYIYHPSSINNYGLFLYWHKKEVDSALYQFKRAYELTKAEFPNHTLLGSIRDNVADIYIEKEQHLKAQPLYKTNFEFYKEAINEKTLAIDIIRLISAGAQLVTTYAKLNRLDEAQQTFNDLENIVMSHSPNAVIQPKSRLEFLRCKETLLSKQNKINAAYATAKVIKYYSDSLETISKIADKKWQEELNDITIDRIALNFKIDHIQKENKIKSQKAKLWISGLLSSVFIILLLVLFFGRRQRLTIAKNKQLLAEQQFENAALKVEQLNSEIKSKERDLSDFAINLTQNQEWALHLAEQLEAIKLANNNEQDALIEALDQDITNKVTFDSDTKKFFERLDKLSDAFYSKLINSFPNLSKNEIRLCSLIRLKIESRSIATLQNITTASLNTSRYRLRKKLSLSEDTDLDFYIQSL